jgi:hypothetical protein
MSRFLGNTQNYVRMLLLVKRYWELIGDNFSKAGWSWGCVSAIDSNRRTIWVVDAHRDDGQRFVVRAEEKLTAFLELERITHELAGSALLGDEGNSDCLARASRALPNGRW